MACLLSRTITVVSTPRASSSSATTDPTRPVTPDTTYLTIRSSSLNPELRRTHADLYCQKYALRLCNNAPMDWDNLQVFLTIARAGRISAAARRLGVEHTTVARRLA